MVHAVHESSSLGLRCTSQELHRNSWPTHISTTTLTFHSKVLSKARLHKQWYSLVDSLTISTLITSAQRLRGLGWGVVVVQLDCIATVKLMGRYPRVPLLEPQPPIQQSERRRRRQH